uniref:Uncharacterized protein n=1 Tax=Kalanchoe fedtschenkoi TaxID=63787 RepID=A0A7N0RGI7_KALFE
MGNAVSSAANSVGSALGNIIAAPFKSAFKGSCESICSGTWDIVCFIEHLCVNDLARLLMIICLCYITLLFLYVLFKIGIFQCIGKSLCKMCWAACEAYWCALHDIACFLCYKIRSTKRVKRGRRRNIHLDVEKGRMSSSDTESSDLSRNEKVTRKRKSFQREHCNVRPTRRPGHHSHRHLRIRKMEASLRLKGVPERSTRRTPKPVRLRNVENARTKGASCKRIRRH